MSTCGTRSITFTIPGSSEAPETQVYVVEQNGDLVFTVDVLETATMTADLRGLFFNLDYEHIDGDILSIDGDYLVTDTLIDPNNVIDLGNGANMSGAVREGFDIGVEFGYAGIDEGEYDINEPVSFTLHSDEGSLTLDILTHMLFGVRLTDVGEPDGHRRDSFKGTVIAPAAPDAIDDAYGIFEDGASGLDDPSKIPLATEFNVLANDTDADGDALTITGIFDAPDHGSVTIAGDGQSLFYTPDLDYSGADSFVYCIYDGNGGTDFASVNLGITAVADIPNLGYSVSAGGSANEIVVTVTTNQTDWDSSEFMDRIELDSVPGDVSVDFDGVNPTGQPDQIVQDFTLTLPFGQSTSFDLGLTAWSQEVSNGDQESSHLSAPITLDYYDIYEDGANGLDDPSTQPAATELGILNDVDRSITGIVSGPGHGSVTIASDGQSLFYTPDLDYAGTDLSGVDSFSYSVSDGNGGADLVVANVGITAVADVPDLSYEIIAGETVNEVIVRVTATQTDADSSEFIDRIELNELPAGVSVVPGEVNPGAEPDQIVQDFVLTLPLNQDTEFDLGIIAVSQEVSNGDQETNSVYVPIHLDYNTNDYAPTFWATDQSIWESGDQFSFIDDRFLGIDRGFHRSSDSWIGYRIDGSVQAGFQSTLTFEGGGIDANLNYDLDIDSHYNQTTDTLLITSSQLLTGGDFVTEGPGGSYDLDFIFDVDISGAVTYDVLDHEGDLISFDIDRSTNRGILDLESSDISGTVDFPWPLDDMSADFAWPDIETDASAQGGGLFSASGASNNFLQLNLDLDGVFSKFTGVYFGLEYDFDWGFLEGDINASLIDVDVNTGMNFLQDFDMQAADGLTGILYFEDGSNQAFTFGDDILLSNASLIDQGGNGDGKIDFSLYLDPQATLSNDTDLGFNVGYDIDALLVHGWVDVHPDGKDAYDVGFGPVWHTDGSVPIASVDVYDDTFDLDFAGQQVEFSVDLFA